MQSGGNFLLPIYGDEMSNMNPDRSMARALAKTHLDQNDPLGWFEALYSQAKEGTAVIPWADMAPNPHLLKWLKTTRLPMKGRRALKIGCGLGDDAEELSRQGFAVTAFDISPSAIQWCKERFPQSQVQYGVADLFHSPAPWHHAFDFVLESYTLQVLPASLRKEAVRCIAEFIAPGGTLLVICRGRNQDDEIGQMPWPVTQDELNEFLKLGLRIINFEDYMDDEDPPVRRFRAEYRG
jgi:SAM-dependent methyltransferase